MRTIIAFSLAALTWTLAIYIANHVLLIQRVEWAMVLGSVTGFISSTLIHLIITWNDPL